jgi:HrpA-like RNA helicase
MVALERAGDPQTRPLGEAVAELPCDPATGAMLVAALAAGCAEHALTVAAMTTGAPPQGVFVAGQRELIATVGDAQVEVFFQLPQVFVVQAAQIGQPLGVVRL